MRLLRQAATTASEALSLTVNPGLTLLYSCTPWVHKSRRKVHCFQARLYYTAVDLGTTNGTDDSKRPRPTKQQAVRVLFSILYIARYAPLFSSLPCLHYHILYVLVSIRSVMRCSRYFTTNSNTQYVCTLPTEFGGVYLGWVRCPDTRTAVTREAIHVCHAIVSVICLLEAST